MSLFCSYLLPTSIRGDFAELFEGGFEVFDNFLGENVRISQDLLRTESFQRLERFERIERLEPTAFSRSWILQGFRL